MKVAIIQIEPVFLNAQKTWNKLKEKILEISEQGVELITWGETLIPGYPSWLSITQGAKFNDSIQKKLYQRYWSESLDLKNSSIIVEMRELAKKTNVMLMGGIAEKGGSSIYCTLLTIGKNGEILGRHRKLKPTYEERLVWADGDELGLKTYPITSEGNVGGLNCWENWLPLARAALHLQGEIIHVSVWPGSLSLTKDITKFMALEGRYYVISASGLLSAKTVHEFLAEEYSFTDESLYTKNQYYQNGGSMIMDPAGNVISGPLIDQEGVLFADIDPKKVIEERQNLDISGHYSRFDIFNKPLDHL